MVEKLPFSEVLVSAGEVETVIRTFKESTEIEDLQWHWDEEDRVVQVIHKTDWLFQFDNSLPQHLEGRIKIPKGTWHRIIKGHGDLSIIVEKIKDI